METETERNIQYNTVFDEKKVIEKITFAFLKTELDLDNFF